ncbi:MAG: hypothetical protein MI756_17260, partial [Chromatiales bacterium]|nr:hypothetical protein [Chromatiales bacterium]
MPLRFKNQRLMSFSMLSILIGTFLCLITLQPMFAFEEDLAESRLNPAITQAQNGTSPLSSDSESLGLDT